MGDCKIEVLLYPVEAAETNTQTSIKSMLMRMPPIKFVCKTSSCPLLNRNIDETI